jgi:hypothetical protein
MRIFARLVLFMGVSLAASGQTTTGPQDYWNKVFADPHSDFNHSPSRLLEEAVRNRKPGAAMDLGMGQGRNAIFLASQGWPCFTCTPGFISQSSPARDGFAKA